MQTKKPIYSEQTEKFVLGGLILDNSCWEEVSTYLTENDFYLDRHKVIYHAIGDLAKSKKPFDMLTITEEVRHNALFKETGEQAYIFELAHETPTVANIKAYAQILKEKTRLRDITAATEAAQMAIANGISSEEIIQSLNETINCISSYTTKHLNLIQACVSFQDLITSDLPEREFILPWLPSGGLALVYAERGLGKTFFALSLSYAIASALDFMKWKITKNVNCLYIDGEMSRSEMKERTKKFSTAPLIRNWMLLSHENFFDKFECDLIITEIETQEAILKLIDENDFGFIVIDNLSSLSRIREDKSDDWREVMLPFLIACRRRGVAVLLVHHAAKSGDQRGTGAREDALDTTIKLSKVENSDSEGACFRLDFTKTRSCFGQEVCPIVAKLVNKNDVLAWDVTNAEQNTKDRMLEIITAGGEDGVFAKDIAEELGISQAMVSKYRNQLIKSGLLQSTKGRQPLKAVIN